MAILATLVTFGISSPQGLLLSGCRYPRGGRYFRGPKTDINIDGLSDYRTRESADVEEIEFFSDSGAKKTKLSAFSPRQKKCVL